MVSAVVNGLLAAPLLIVVMAVSNDRSVMGKYRNGVLARSLGWITTALMSVAGMALIYVIFLG